MESDSEKKRNKYPFVIARNLFTFFSNVDCVVFVHFFFVAFTQTTNAWRCYDISRV